jgi:hypothetical protein
MQGQQQAASACPPPSAGSGLMGVGAGSGSGSGSGASSVSNPRRAGLTRGRSAYLSSSDSISSLDLATSGDWGAFSSCSSSRVPGAPLIVGSLPHNLDDLPPLLLPPRAKEDEADSTAWGSLSESYGQWMNHGHGLITNSCPGDMGGMQAAARARAQSRCSQGGLTAWIEEGDTDFDPDDPGDEAEWVGGGYEVGSLTALSLLSSLAAGQDLRGRDHDHERSRGASVESAGRDHDTDDHEHGVFLMEGVGEAEKKSYVAQLGRGNVDCRQ